MIHNVLPAIHYRPGVTVDLIPVDFAANQISILYM